MPSSVVFLGPSLPLEEARAILDAEFLPPVQRGDIENLLHSKTPDAVGIVDGRFLQNFSISPKEILRGMDAGIKMFGSSSMGALRAVELARYGMAGVGQVYGLFASGGLDADDEVAMVFDPADFSPLSVPLVNMRIALESALAEGIISTETRDIFVDAAKRIYFPERTYKRVLKEIEGRIPTRESIALGGVISVAPDAKRQDAIQLLHEMKTYLAGRDS